jgi:hypothetical protein
MTPGNCILIKADDEPAIVPLFLGSDFLAPPVCSVSTILFANLGTGFSGEEARIAKVQIHISTDTSIHVYRHAATHAVGCVQGHVTT